MLASVFTKHPFLRLLATSLSPSSPLSLPSRVRDLHTSPFMDAFFKKTKGLGRKSANEKRTAFASVSESLGAAGVEEGVGKNALEGLGRGATTVKEAEVQVKVSAGQVVIKKTRRSTRVLQKAVESPSLTETTALVTATARKRKGKALEKLREEQVATGSSVSRLTKKRGGEDKGKGTAVVASLAGSGELAVNHDVRDSIGSVPLLAISLSTASVMADAIAHLSSANPKLAQLIATHGNPELKEFSCAFQSLVRSIVYQQLAGAAAAAIHNRLSNLCQGVITPAAVLALTAAEMRSVGISERKGSYLHDLAQHFASGQLSNDIILAMDDEVLMKALTGVRGIGVWSVHMFMIFTLHRPDVLPVGDLGVRKGFQLLFGLPNLPTPTHMEQLADRWRPYRSVGSWYMWRLVEASK